MIGTATDYAINKATSDAIVYRDTYGTVIQLTCTDFSSEEEFILWKAISDENYHDIEKEEHLYADHVVSFETLAAEVGHVHSVETMMINRINEEEIAAAREEIKQRIMNGLTECLTERQRTHLWLFCVEGMTMTEIARRYGVSQPAITKSIAAAKKKLKKYAE